VLYLLLTWFYCNGNDLNTLQHVGAWRSLVAYLNGVQRAGGSNPLAPTNETKGLTSCWFTPFLLSSDSLPTFLENEHTYAIFYSGWKSTIGQDDAIDFLYCLVLFRCRSFRLLPYHARVRLSFTLQWFPISFGQKECFTGDPGETLFS
jgi:hypothetical protein